MIIAVASFFAIFGIASVAGGLLGWKKAKSQASLVAGSVAGSLLLSASAALVSGAINLGLGLGGATSLLLAGRFVPGYLKTRKWMPQGMMAVFSMIATVLSIATFLAQ